MRVRCCVNSSNIASVGDKIFSIYIDNAGLPTVKYTLVIKEELKFKVFHENDFVFSARYENIMKTKRISCFTEIVRDINFLHNLPSRITIDVGEAK